MLFCIATIVQWVDSHFDHDFLWYGQIGRYIDRIGIITEPGRLQLFADIDKDATPGGNGWNYTHWPRYNESAVYQQPVSYETVYWNRWGFLFYVDRYFGPVRSWAFFVPHWFLVLVFAILPAWWCIAFVRRRHVPSGHLCCRQCGYDLRASIDRCPECGTPIPAPSEAKA